MRDAAAVGAAVRAAAGAAVRATPARPLPTHWHPRWLLEAPHRLAFFAGALVLAGSGLWWAAVLLVGPHVPWQLPPGTAHGLLMGFGFMPCFFAGFLFTAGPKWLARPAVPASTLRLPLVAGLLGWPVFVVGAHLHAPLAAGGLALAATGFGLITWRFHTLVRASTVADRTHPRLVLTGCAIGTLLLASAAVALALGHIAGVRAALHAGLWACMTLVFVSVVHRMLPFFSTVAVPWLDAWRPLWLLWVLVAAVGVEAPLAAVDALGLAVPPVLRWAQAGLEAMCAGWLLYLALRWVGVKRPSIRLLVMLYLGFVWLGVAFALAAVSHALHAASGGVWHLGLAPLHALMAGFFGSLLFAMVGRVSAGHSGHAVAADNTLWRLFWLLQCAVLARVVAALWPGGAGVLLPVAALAWAAAAGLWALRYSCWYGRPPADGRPG